MFLLKLTKILVKQKIGQTLTKLQINYTFGRLKLVNN